MRTDWKKGSIEICLWMMGEIALNFLGLDTLADYSEFILNSKINQFSYGLNSQITTIADK